MNRIVLTLFAAGTLFHARGGFVLLENFSSLTNGNLNGQGGWVSSGADGQVVTDPADPLNQVLAVTGTAGNAYKALGAMTISNNTTGTVFFRMRRANTAPNLSAGLCDLAAPTAGSFGDFETQLNCNTLTPPYLSVRDAANFRVIGSFTNDVWFNVWMVANNTRDLVTVYMQGGPLVSQTLLQTNGEYAFTFRNTTGDGFNTNTAPQANPLLTFNVKTTSGHVGPLYVDDVYLDTSGTNLASPLGPDTNAPVIVATEPPAGATVYALSEIAVTFNEPVTNIAAAHLRVNGASATNLTGSGTVWTFRFPQPPLGAVSITWATNHTITDLASNRFDGASATWSYTLSPADVTPPIVTSIAPTAGTTLATLGQIIITFNETVRGVDAEDLLINNVAALWVTNAGNSWFFGVPPQPPGLVTASFDSGHGITDLAGNAFDHTQPFISWEYTLLDTVAPTVTAIRPTPGAIVASLTQIELLFSEPVTGVDAADLRINGQPATNLLVTPAGWLRFEFMPAATGTATVSWAVGHGIRDTAPVPNDFAGGSWTYRNDPVAAAGDVVINEFLADNLVGLVDADGQKQDWIELHNRGANAVNLLGWSLTDDPGQPGLWTFPALTLNPGQYLVVYASGKDRKNTAPGTTNHTSFRLNSTGDYLGLYNAQWPPQVVHEFTPGFPEQRADVSYGRMPDGSLAYFSVPTPGRSNDVASAVAGFVEPPQASAQSGFYGQPFQVVLSTRTPGAVIRYTLNGSPPTAASPLYTNPLPVSGTPTQAVVMLRAAAFKTGMLGSTITTRSYIFPDHVLTQPANPAGFPAIWDSPCTLSGQNCTDTTGDYEMDPQVLTNTAAGYPTMARQGLVSVPTLSIVTDVNLLFGPAAGVYVRREPFNQQQINAELIHPDGTEGFNIDCGLEIQGQTSPTDSGGNWKSKKLSMRLLFKGEFGATKLRYKLFPDSPVDEFDTLIVSAGHNMYWNYMPNDDQRKRAQYVRDQYTSDLQIAAGGLAPRGRFLHVYLNGLYWGLHELHERPDHSFSASYFGGDKSEYDSLKHDASTIVNGSNTSYLQMLSVARSGLANNAVYEQLQQLLDLPGLVDYLLVNFWVGNEDWAHKNWYASRRRSAEGRWRYFAWDSEHVVKNTANDSTTLNQSGSPTELFQLLRQNAEFRVLFGDRVHRHFFNGGIFYTDTNNPIWNAAFPDRAKPVALYMKRIAEIDPAIVCESARWGDVGTNGVNRSNNPCTRNVEWLSELNALLGKTNTSGYTWNFFPTRTTNVLRQLRGVGVYPTVAAPAFRQHGGRVPRGYLLHMTNAAGAGVVYYTLNGVDPRVYGSGAVSGHARAYTNGQPVVLNLTTTVKARTLVGTNWSALNEATFTVAELGPQLHLTEIMYNPIGDEPYEFLELRNDGVVPLDVSGWTLVGVTYAFPPGTILAPGQTLVLANSASPAAFAARYPGVTVFGWWSDGKLDNGGERIAVLDATGNIVVSVDYRDSGGWPKAADGAGYSLETIDPFGDPDAASNWRATSFNGTPGSLSANPAPGPVRFNELMADNVSAVANADTFPDWVELHNTSEAEVDLAGWSLSDDSNPRKFVFPAETVIPAGGYLVVWCDTNAALPGLHAGFNLDRDGETVSLFNTSTTRVDALTYGLQLPDYSLGRLADDWALAMPTPGASNVAAAVAGPTNLVINEWLANAPPGGSDWIELFNTAADPLALRGLFLATSNGQHRLGSLSFLGARGYLQLLADEQPGARHLDFKLPAAGGAIMLYDESAIEISRVTYGPQLERVSAGRLPDASATLTNFVLSPSPGASNYIVSYSGPLLNEVMAVNRSALTNPAGNFADWVELYNPLGTDFALSGCRLSTAFGNPSQWVFPAGVLIPARGYLVVWFDNTQPVSLVNGPELNTGRALDGDSDEVYLFNAEGLVVDAVEWGPQAPDFSLGRVAGAWKLLAAPTPGATNAAPASLGSSAGLRLNEWLARPNTNQDEFVELHNPGAQPMELSGLYLTDDLTIVGLTKFQIAPLSFIGPRGFTEFKADGDPRQGRHHLNFSLDADAESLRLYSATLGIIDTVVFGLQSEGISEGRLPDGAGGAAPLACPTPGASNALASTILITAQPQSQAVPAGASATFTVSIVAGGPVGYQWFFNDQPIPGANEATFTLTNVQAGDLGDYQVLVTNACASVASAVATLSLAEPPPPPQIVANPADVAVLIGQPASFSVTATGAPPLTYQWFFGGQPVNAATNDTLAFTSAALSNAGPYHVVVANVAGMATSAVATLTVLAPPAITSQPRSCTNTVGETASFSVSASSALPLAYQWRFNGMALSGATNPVLNLPGVALTNAGEYRALVTNSVGAILSDRATLTVVGPPALVGPLALDAAGLRFSLTGQRNRDYAVESSLLLTNWSNVFTVRLTNSPQEILDPGATNGRGFYRVRLLQ